ncbi:MAG: hypothetical protein QGI21_05500 [Candidatus Poseidoniaceae archaeon]|jgi:hypothetical protein|nr:hypothetical protein [Candidatus Poseidoniaceae archaeon]
MGEEVHDPQFRHVLIPCIAGIILVMVSASLFREEYPPMVVSMVLGIFVSPILAMITKPGTIWEYSLGVTVVCLPVGGLWMLGSSYWNVALTFILWAWASAKWQSTTNPPFKVGIWHGFGMSFSIVPGAILFGIIFGS